LVARGRDLRFDAFQGRRVLGIGIRLGIELLDGDFAAAGLPELREQVLDPSPVRFDRQRDIALAEVQADLDRRFELAENRARALGERVQPTLRQVDSPPRRAQHQIEEDEDDQRSDEAPGRIQQTFRLLVHDRSQPVRWLRMTTPVANSAYAITERKYSRSRESSIPFWKPS